MVWILKRDEGSLESVKNRVTYILLYLEVEPLDDCEGDGGLSATG